MREARGAKATTKMPVVVAAEIAVRGASLTVELVAMATSAPQFVLRGLRIGKLPAVVAVVVQVAVGRGWQTARAKAVMLA